jgi:hypothetical protein
MSNLDVNALAEHLHHMAASLQQFIDVQAEAVAEPRILAAQLEAKAARDEQHRQAEADARRLTDLQAEIARHRNAWERHADRLEAEAKQTQAAIRAVEALKTWTNEDGRQFVFAEDLWAALADVSYVAKVAVDSRKEIGK